MKNTKIISRFIQYILLTVGCVILFSINCQFYSDDNPDSLINTTHLAHLSKDLVLDKTKMTIVYIYAEFPDYEWTPAPGEGITCVDDVARAVIFYLRDYKYSRQPEILNKTRKMLNFILYMQADNGLFYNFLLGDSSINTDHINSQSRASWWSWRAIWALAEAYEFYRSESPEYANSLLISIEKTFPAIDSLLSAFPQKKEEEGFLLPTWLPYATAADQASVMLQALIPYYRITRRVEVEKYIQKLADGIRLMQVGDSLHFPFGCFLSWRNKWHAYGNSQAYALLLAGELLNKPEYIQSALDEIDYFYPYLIKNQYLNELTIANREGHQKILDMKKFSQIAYGIRPMVWACLKAHDLTKEDKYGQLAGEIACWLLGNNITGQPLYFPQSGRCYDGINDESTLNKNSGAESTIEALLTILEAEKNPVSSKIITDYYHDSSGNSH